MFKCDVTKEIGPITLSCDLKVENNRLLVILGPSGCGKSTLLNLITGIMEPDTGHISIGNVTAFNKENKLNQNISERHIGYIQQSGYLFPHMNVKQNILYSIPKKVRPEHDERYQDLMKLLNLEEHEMSYPNQLSGGQKQRVAIGRALMMSPRLMLWDEPFSALDHQIRKEMRTLVKKVKKELGIPMIFVTHDLDEAYDLADDLAVMDFGKILQNGDRSTVMSFPKTSRVQDIIGKGMGPVVIGFSGVSGSGKTTVIEYLIRDLRQLGLKVGTIKHDGHDFDMDHRGKDSYRHRQAGANRVIVSSSKKYAILTTNENEEMTLEALLSEQRDMDVVIFEGFKHSVFKKFEVIRGEVSQEPVCDPDALLGIISDLDLKIVNSQSETVPVYPMDAYSELVAYILDRIKENKGER